MDCKHRGNFIIIVVSYLKHYEVRNVYWDVSTCQYVSGDEFKYCIDECSLENNGNITGWLIKPGEEHDTVAIKVVLTKKWR